MTIPKRLVKSKKDRVFAGVCSGLAHYLDIDPLVVRIVFVLLAIFGGSGLVIYIILWLFVPGENQESNATQEEILKDNLDDIQDRVNDFTKKFERVDKKYLPGAIFIFFGLLILLKNIGILNAGYVVPLILFAFGFYLILRQ
ncbi:PspC domain-containing protein [Patescibacteria group bacterium]|nr:PspC domain-containing protein [Patescibacteria group bacterium]